MRLDRTSRNLGLLWIGQFVSLVGDAFLDVTLAFLVLLIAGGSASAKTGVVLLFHYLPFLVVGPFAGALADRTDQRRLMIAADLARAALLATLPIAFLTGHLSWPLLAVVAFLVATASSAFAPARDALLPRLAEGRSLVAVNASFQTSSQLAYIVGTVLSGLLLGWDRSSVRADAIVRLYWFDAASFLASFVTLLLVAAPRAERPTTRGPGALADVLEGLRHARRSRLVSGLLFLTAVDNFCIMGPAIIGATLLIKDTFGLAPAHLALLEGALGVGWLAGSLVVLRFGTAWPKGRVLLFGILMDGLTFVPVYWIRSYPLLLAAMAFHGLWIPFIQVARTTLVQENVPPALLGRAFSLINLTFVGFTGLSLLATGWLGESLAPPAIFLVAGAGGAVAGLAGLAFRDLRRAR